MLIAYQHPPGWPVRIQIGRRKDAGGGLFARRAYAWRHDDGLGRLIPTQEDFDRSSVPIRAQDVNDLRNGLTNDGASPALGAVTAGASVIRASDFGALATAAQQLWNMGVYWNPGQTGPKVPLGALPDWSSGVTPGGPSVGTGQTPIYLSDRVDLRQWVNAYETAAGKTVGAWSSPAGTVIAVNRHYDGRNQLLSQSVPHVLYPNVLGQFNGSDGSSLTPQTTYTCDAERRLTQASAPGRSLQNTDDGDGRRVIGVTGGVSTTYYLWGWYEDNPASPVATVYCPFDGQALAMQRLGAVTYLHHDHLGSLVSATQSNQIEVGWARFSSFAAGRAIDGRGRRVADARQVARGVRVNGQSGRSGTRGAGRRRRLSVRPRVPDLARPEFRRSSATASPTSTTSRATTTRSNSPPASTARAGCWSGARSTIGPPSPTATTPGSTGRSAFRSG